MNVPAKVEMPVCVCVKLSFVAFVGLKLCLISVTSLLETDRNVFTLSTVCFRYVS